MAKRAFQAHDPIESDRAYRFRTLKHHHRGAVLLKDVCNLRPNYDLSQFMHSPSCQGSQLDRGTGRGVPANELRFERMGTPRRGERGRP
jgi:hypothetical protein